MHRWHWTPISLLVAGVLATWIVALAHAATLGWWQALVYLGGGLSLGAIYWLRRELSKTEVELESLKSAHDQDLSQLQDDRRLLDSARKEFEKHVSQQLETLDKREHALAERFVAFHEWLEVPQPVDLRQPQAENELTDAELLNLARKDREALALLQQETRVVFDHIVNNRYAPDGTFQPNILRDDLFQLITRVARVYNPNAEQPLLETSLARVMRGVSRASLHFLAQLDELPLNVKDYNINSLYGYIRQAVNAYKSFKAAEPYFPYANAAWYLGRLAMGANPLSLGAWWFLGSVGKQGAQALATQLINRQALGLLGNLVRVVGYEVAALYGGDFRHRDPNWIYAAELTDLVARFPLSRDSLSHALKELGALQLRSEYDRVFLYRCLASQKSADPARYRPLSTLTGEERRAIVQRLERFCQTFVHGATPAKLTQWQADVESRLGIKVSAARQGEPLPVREQREDALRSLASFLLGQKEKEPGELSPLLQGTRTYRALDGSQQQTLLQSLHDNPPFFFEQPNLDPDGPIAETYLQDLAGLQVRVTPRSSELDDVVADTAAYLRREPAKIHALLDQEYLALLAERFAPGATAPKLDGRVARAALDLLQPGETIPFLYSGGQLEAGSQPLPAEWEKAPLWLIGIADRLVLFAAEPQPRCVWTATRSNVEVTKSGKFLNRAALLRGGEWAVELASLPEGVRVPAPLIRKAGFFRPLLDWAGAPATSFE